MSASSETRALLLLHPLGSDRTFWDPVLPDLEDVVTTVAIDLPGHGRADMPPPGAGIPEFTDAVVAALPEGERFHVAGVSLGGLVAQDLADRYPEVVDRLILVDTVATYPEAMRTMWRERAQTARSRGLNELADPMEAMWFSESFRSGGAPTVARTREVFLAMDPEGYARTCEALEGADTTASVPAIRTSTLVMCGSLDLPPFTESAKWLHEQIPDAELIWLEGAKHASPLEQPEQFAAAVKAFLP